MGFSVRDRGMIEKIIDVAIKSVPGWMDTYRAEEVRKFYHYDKVEDFVLGMCNGYILSGFTHLYRLEHNENPPPDQVTEFINVINNRMSQIREAIFKTG